MLLPPARLKSLPDLGGDVEVRLVAGFDQLVLRIGPEGVHPTVQ
jgi:hypothetical protein